jgi:hypothetical protein
MLESITLTILSLEDTNGEQMQLLIASNCALISQL